MRPLFRFMYNLNRTCEMVYCASVSRTTTDPLREPLLAPLHSSTIRQWLSSASMNEGVYVLQLICLYFSQIYTFYCCTDATKVISIIKYDIVLGEYFGRLIKFLVNFKPSENRACPLACGARRESPVLQYLVSLQYILNLSKNK